MVSRLRIIILSLCITGAVTLRAEAQTPASIDSRVNPQVQQLRQEIQTLGQQIKPLRSQLQQAKSQKNMTQVNVLKEQIRPILKKIKADRAKLRSLVR